MYFINYCILITTCCILITTWKASTLLLKFPRCVLSYICLFIILYETRFLSTNNYRSFTLVIYSMTHVNDGNHLIYFFHYQKCLVWVLCPYFMGRAFRFALVCPSENFVTEFKKWGHLRLVDTFLVSCALRLILLSANIYNKCSVMKV